MQSDLKAPLWQRAVCGLLCLGGALALPFNAIHGDYHGWHGIAQIILGIGGAYLFGHLALRGRLYGKVSGTEHVHFRHADRRRNT